MRISARGELKFQNVKRASLAGAGGEDAAGNGAGLFPDLRSESRSQEMNHAMKMGEEWGELQRKQEFDGGRRTGLLLLMCAGEPAV